MIFSQPLTFKHWITARPIGPPPRTRTESPFLKGLILMACHATAIGSTSAGGQRYYQGYDDSETTYHQLPARRNPEWRLQRFEVRRHARRVRRPNLVIFSACYISSAAWWIPTTQSDETILVAAVDEARFTGPARAVVYDRLYHNSFSDLHIAHTFANLFDYPAELVAQGERCTFSGNGMRCGWYYVGTAEILVEV